MNDPTRFEHIEMQFTISNKENYARVVMKFRGKNAFGGMVLNSIKARIRLDDWQVISIEK